MSRPIIEVKNFIKKYGAFTAVDNISFDVAEGSIRRVRAFYRKQHEKYADISSGVYGGNDADNIFV